MDTRSSVGPIFPVQLVKKRNTMMSDYRIHDLS